MRAGRGRWVGGLGLSVWLLVAAGLRAQTPEITVTQRTRTSGGASSPILGMGDGEPSFLKPDRPVRGLSSYGNLEGELLASRLLTELGFLTPQGRRVTVTPRYWDLNFRARPYLQAEQITADFTRGQPVWELRTLPLDKVQALDMAQVRRLALVDAIMGNGDRHRGNLLFTQTEGGKVIPLPIDHNFALAGEGVVSESYWQRNFLEGYEGVTLPNDRVHDARKIRGHQEAGTLNLILQRNSLYRRILIGALHDSSQWEAMLDEARRLQAELSDAMIEREVARLADSEIGAADPAARRRELVEVLKARRDRLVGALEAYRRRWGRQMVKQGLEVRQLLEVLPEDLLKRTTLSEGARIRLTEMVAAWDLLYPGDVYRALRLEGVEPLLAREITAAVMRARGQTFAVAATIMTEQQLQESRVLEALEAARPRPGENPLLAGRALGEVPFDVRRDPRGVVELVDVRGQALPEAHRQALEPLVTALLREVSPAAGERLLVRREPFAGAGTTRFRAQLVEASGRPRAEFELRLTGGQPVEILRRELAPPRTVPGVEGEYGSGLRLMELAEVRALRSRIEQRATELAIQGKVEDAAVLRDAARDLRTMEAGGRPLSRREVFARPEVKAAATVLRIESTAPRPSTGRYKPGESRVRLPRILP